MFSSSKFWKLHQQNTISFISFQEVLVVKKAKKAMAAKARTKANVRPLTNSGMKARHRLYKTLWHHFWLKSYRLQPTSMTRVWKFFVYWELCMLSTVIGDPYLKVFFNDLAYVKRYVLSLYIIGLSNGTIGAWMNVRISGLTYLSLTYCMKIM